MVEEKEFKLLETLNLNQFDTKKKIVFGYENWIIGGVERVLLTLFENLSNEYTIYLIIPMIDKSKPYYPVPSYVKLIEVGNEEISFSRCMALVSNYIHADLFIGNGNLNSEFLKVYKYLQEFKIKSIMFNHYNWIFPYMHEAFMSKVIEARNENISYPDSIVCLTNITSYLCSKLSNKSNVITIPNPNQFSKCDNIQWEDRENIIVSVARYDDYFKRLDKVLSIFSKVYEQNASVKLVIVGKVSYKDTFQKDMDSELKRLGIPKSAIELTGPQQDVSSFYKKAKSFLFASEIEGFGLVLNEAGCFGVPVVANYYLGIEDIISFGENGYFYSNSESDDIPAKYLLEIITNESKWKFMNEKSYELSLRFDEAIVMKKWNQVIKDTMNDHLEIESTYQPTKKEYEETISLHVKYINTMVNRINRADKAQDELYNLYTENDVYRVSLKYLIKALILKLPFVRLIKSRYFQ